MFKLLFERKGGNKSLKNSIFSITLIGENQREIRKKNPNIFLDQNQTNKQTNRRIISLVNL
jgi:hypothetical protein